jgi:hypothetical protein
MQLACWLAVLTAAAAQTPPPVQGPSPEELERISEGIALDRQAADEPPLAPAAPQSTAAAIQSLNPDLAFVLDFTGAYFTDDQPLQLGGHDPRRTGFNLQQLELHVASNVDPFLRFEADIVFGLFEVEVEEVFGTSLALPFGLQVRAGQFFTRFGRINAMHPHSWRFVDQSLVIGKFFGGEGNRGLGTEISWLSPLPWFAEVVVSVTDPTDDYLVRTAADLVYTSALEQFFPLSSDWSLLVGLSSQFGPDPSGVTDRTDIYGTDLYLRYRPLEAAGRSSVSWQTELLWRRRHAPGLLLADVGGYSQVVWQLDAEWETGVRYDYVEGLANDPLAPDWTADRHRYAALLTYYPSHFSRIRLQGSCDDPTWRQEPIWAAFLALELVAGAHGAHGY